MMRNSTILGIAAAVTALFAAPGAAQAGPLGLYNLMVFGDMTGTNSDVEGALAVGGNLSLTGYSVGLMAPATDTNLVVGGNLTALNGTNYGDAVVGGSASYTGWTSTGSRASGASLPVDFAAEETRLDALSTYFAAMAQTGTVTDMYGQLTLTASGSGLNIFNIDAATYDGTNTFTINAAADATVIVNIAGASQSMKYMGMVLNGGIDESNIIYNFYQATQLEITGIDVRGSVLAPLASLNAGGGVVNGQVIVESFLGPMNGLQFNDKSFDGDVPTPSAVPEPASWAMLIFGFAAVGGAMRRRHRRGDAAIA